MTLSFDVLRDGCRVASPDKRIAFPIAEPSPTGHDWWMLRQADAPCEPGDAWPTPKRLRFLVFTVPGRLITPARHLRLRLATPRDRLAQWLAAIQLLPAPT